MSFQGDVAGIGLGELLQGLSRGGRDGVLTLFDGQNSSCLGLHRGQLYLLPGPDDTPERWRERALCAFANDPSPDMEGMRRERIAHAARLEQIYQMLEAKNLHFRFEPGALPSSTPAAKPSAPSPVKGISMDGVGVEAPIPKPEPDKWGPGLTVEYVLLEQARIWDESRNGPGSGLSGHDIPRAVDPDKFSLDDRAFLEQCDGTSTLQEIADRMGWPLSQCCATTGEFLLRGALRMAGTRELLAGAQRELEQGRFGRAASRLAGWVVSSPHGAPLVDDADLLVGEWENGRMKRVLPVLDRKIARALLRKLDHVHVDKRASRERWRALHEAHRTDDTAALHGIKLQLTATDDPDAKTFKDLLRLARHFQERGHGGRTRALLRLASTHVPRRPQVKIEIGKRMIETGLVEEGTRWLLETARELLDQTQPEKAVFPLRAVLRELPDHEEAHALLEESKLLQTRLRRRRWSSTTGVAVILILSTVAVVKYRAFRQVESWVTRIEADALDPKTAIQHLDEAFGTEPPERIAVLREKLLEEQHKKDRAAFKIWSDEYAALEERCRFGDPLEALRKTLSLERPPGVPAEVPGFPERQDLLGIMASRLGERSLDVNPPIEATQAELNQEERFAELLLQVIGVLEESGPPPEAVSFQFRIQELRNQIVQRREKRALDRERLQQERLQSQQDILLGTARAHAEHGDLERSIAAYERLMQSDPDLASLPILREEFETVRTHYEAAERALELAVDGEHEAAEAALEGVCPRPIEHQLPFRVESRPTGARVTMGDGSVRTTPFVAKSGIGEPISVHVTYTGFTERYIELDRPRDLLVYLHRFPERSWENEHRIDAIPVASGNDHVVTDRYGRIRRLDEDSNARWEIELETLGGIARTPVFLPGKPGHLLIVSEDGQVWILNASTGATEGPYDVGSPPVEGPTLTRSGVHTLFTDGRVGVWTDSLEPHFYQAQGRLEGAEESSSTVVVLRKSVDASRELVSPWNHWRVEVREEDFRVVTPDGRGFTAIRHGDWSFVSWESPKAGVPNGRLWVSDEAGLRSYLPGHEDLVVFGTR